MPAGSILWGYTSSGLAYQNTLLMGYVGYNVVTDRESRAGSQQLQAPSGVEDAWITGRDYTMTMEVRWIDDSPAASPSRAPVGGPLAWQDFLDYARAKNPFRFCPDASLPAAYVDGCYLMEPLLGFGKNQENLQRTMTLKLRNPTVDFIRALRGVLFEYAPGQDLMQPVAATFSRPDATTCATYVDAAGMVRVVPANVLRDAHYIGGVRTTLLEDATTNLCLQSENFGTTWAMGGGTGTRTASALTCGTVSLDLLVDTDAVNQTVWSQAFVFNGPFPAAKGVSVIVAAPTTAAAGGSYVQIYDTTASIERLGATITWSGGAPVVSMSSGTYLGTEALANGCYRLLFATSACVADNHLVAVMPALVPNQTGNLYVGGVQIEDAAFPSSYIKTTTAQVRRASDALSLPYSAAPQAMSLYVAYLEHHPVVDATNNITIGDGAAPYLRIYRGGGNYWRAAYNNGAGSTIEDPVTNQPSYGARCETLATLTSAGVLQLTVTIAGGAAVASPASAGLTLPGAWSSGAVAGAYMMAVERICIAAGIRTLAQMRAM